MPPRPALLCILDGWGFRPDHAEDNAIEAAHTPNYTRLLKECPHALLQTSGNAVGLPKGQMGNSEVGHMNIGAGRIVRPGSAAYRRRHGGWLPGTASRLVGTDHQGETDQRCGACDGFDVAGRRAFPSRSDRRLGENLERRRCAGVCACFSGWPRHPAQKRQGLCREIP